MRSSCNSNAATVAAQRDAGGKSRGQGRREEGGERGFTGPGRGKGSLEMQEWKPDAMGDL